MAYSVFDHMQYDVGKNPVLLRCPEGHVAAIHENDFEHLGNIGAYFECTKCWHGHHKVTVLTANMRTNKARGNPNG